MSAHMSFSVSAGRQSIGALLPGCTAGRSCVCGYFSLVVLLLPLRIRAFMLVHFAMTSATDEREKRVPDSGKTMHNAINIVIKAPD